MNPARQAALHGGLPKSVPAMTVNRVCGSGAQAIATAAQEVRLGDAHCMIAGGMENMDRGPYLLDRARWGYRMGPGTVDDATLRDGLNDAFSDEQFGLAHRGPRRCARHHPQGAGRMGRAVATALRNGTGGGPFRG